MGPTNFNEAKPRPIGNRLSGGKVAKKLHKSVEQLKRHDPDVIVASEPTQMLFVSNSSVLCGVTLEELEEIFSPFDENCDYIVFPNKRSYSFVKFSSVEKAVRAYEELNGLVHPSLKTSHLPFVIAYVDNLPAGSSKDSIPHPKGLTIDEEFISEEEEKQLLELIMTSPRLSHLKHRAVLHFGHEFDYSSNSSFEPCEAIPDLIQMLIERMKRKGYCEWEPDQVTANVYEAGQGIPSHYDTHSAFEDPILSLSMQSDVVMDFKDGANSARVCGVLLPRRSLCIMSGESRYRWKHGIVNRQYDVDPVTHRVVRRQLRVSLTLRKIRREPCQCDFKEYCDWDRQGEMSVPKTVKDAAKLESTYVADVYEEIASHFDETRHSNWRSVQKYLDALPSGSVLYDVGCGNGKYLVTKDKLIKMGCDLCEGLCRISYEKGCSVVRADALHLPYRDNSADAVISIAVLHHLSCLERRIAMVREILRVLKSGGTACITVWNIDQSGSEYGKMRDNREEVEEIKESIERLKVHDGKQFVQQDVLVPWQIEGVSSENKGETFLRYYHIFVQGEFEELIRQSGGCTLESIVSEQGNWIAVLRKEDKYTVPNVVADTGII